jgi:two-component system OmpR family sensor kinase
VLERSRNLGSVVLPLRELDSVAGDFGSFEITTLSGPDIEAMAGRPRRVRLLTLRRDAPDVEPFCLQVAASLAPLERSVAMLRLVVVGVVLAGLVVTGVMLWFVTGRALVSIQGVAADAKKVTASEIGARLTLPSGPDELVGLVGTLNLMLDRLESAFRAQDRFLANAAHELKTPVAVLLGQAQVFGQRARTPEEADRFAADVQDEMRRLGQIVNSMLILARADAGFSLAGARPVSVNDLVTGAVANCLAQAQQREVRLVPTLALPDAGHPDPAVLGDPDLLRVALVNLIRNAVRYSPADDVVEVVVDLDATDVRVAVRDNGPGVSEEVARHMFDRFYSASRDDETFRGTGLGLAIVKSVTDLHRGGVSVTIRPNGGCEFVVRLPLVDQKNLEN